MGLLRLSQGAETVSMLWLYDLGYNFCMAGSVKVWDPRQANDPVACMEPAEGETRRDCWTVAFGNSYNDTERCVCAGYDNGDIKMFDMRKMTCRWETNVKNGVSLS